MKLDTLPSFSTMTGQEGPVDLTDKLKNDNIFFKKMIDLIPAKFYFDKDKLSQSRDATKSDEEKVFKRPLDTDSSFKLKAKKSKYDPAQIKTVSQIQEELNDIEEEQKKLKKKTKKKKKVTENEEGEDDDDDDTSSLRSAAESMEDLREKLHNRIEELKGKRKNLGKDEWVEKKRLKRRASKLKLKMKRQKEKQNKVKGAQNNISNGVSAPKVKKPVSDKPIYNKEGKMVFSKFDFTGSGEQKKIKNDLPTGKNYKKLLQKVTKDKEKLQKLEEEDKGAAKTLKSKIAWQTALQKAEGVKIKDNPELLKKSMKKQEALKKKSGKEWKERTEKLDQKMKSRQDKRKKNIQAKKQSRVDKKIKKSKKKGRIVPGF